MEHSLLHATQLLGLLLALAAPLLALTVLLPARDRAALTSAAGRLSDELLTRTARGAAIGALVAAIACLLNLLVQVAEFEGTTVFAGAAPATIARFATRTTVGQLALVRALLLLAIGALGWRIAGAPTRARSRATWVGLLALAAAAVLSSAMVSHAAAQPQLRVPAIAFHFLHLVAAATWVGILAHLFLTRRLLLASAGGQQLTFVAAVVRRFSPLALLGAALLVATGGVGAWFYLGTPAALLTSAYGLTLLTKLSLLAILVAGGAVNARIVRPALLRLADAPGENAPRADGSAASSVLARLVRTIELEVTAGVLVIVTAGILASVSPPTPAGEGRLNPAQVASIVTPRAPRTAIVDPATWVGSATRTDDDLRYSEFMHGWSGVLVCVLALGWLVQSVAGESSVARAAAWVWPAALIPFAIFVAIASDPEVWPMGTVSPWVALTDPIVLEHRIGAMMIVVLAALGWREARGGGRDRPLGRALPIVMIAGSLLLLGHAHSSFSASDDLTTIINVQHAVLGGLGVLAGVVRWLELRDLVPRRVAGIVWPVLVLAIGLFMTLSYRELV